MTQQNNNPVICRNGHRQPVSHTKFCIYCGTPLAVQTPPQNQPQNRPVQNAAPPPNQNPGGQQNVQPGQTPVQPNQMPPANPMPPQQMPVQYQNQPPFPNQQMQPVPPVYPQQYNQNYQQPYQGQVVQALSCYTCGGDGRLLPEKTIICRECRWLRPLIPGYRVDESAFAWAADGKAMAALKAIKPLNAAAKAVSEKVGQRWIETTFNGVRLGERQLPHIYAQAVKAARILGMTHMPGVYLSGERPWDCMTFGTEKDSFIVIGSAIAGNFQGVDLLFLLAREMGHCQAGHALWKTVIRFFLGEQGPAKGFMAGGIFNAILSPTALISGAIEMPLLAWARQAEITADRAGLLCVGSEEIARRVLLSWTLKSSFIYRQINIEAWLEQQSADDEGYSKLAEMTTTSVPYITPRLKLLNQFSKSPELQHWRKIIIESIKRSAPAAEPKPAAQTSKPSDVLKTKCGACQTPMRIPLKVFEGKTELSVKCPNPKCGKLTRLKKSLKPAAGKPPVSRPTKREENLDYGD